MLCPCCARALRSGIYVGSEMFASAREERLGRRGQAAGAAAPTPAPTAAASTGRGKRKTQKQLDQEEQEAVLRAAEEQGGEEEQEAGGKGGRGTRRQPRRAVPSEAAQQSKGSVGAGAEKREAFIMCQDAFSKQEMVRGARLSRRAPDSPCGASTATARQRASRGARAGRGLDGARSVGCGRVRGRPACAPCE